ncbi:hypothetical protein OL548_13490 [Lysinibacillus sp. MHQ-1]|nr:hypothetical protein OL548_13490 [Lysinibacillus sp. MHQ-1]
MAKQLAMVTMKKNDLDAVVNTVKAMIGEDAILGIHGESMGAATMLLYAGTVEDGADFLYFRLCILRFFPCCSSK